jgi:rhamnosyltransferase
VNLRRLLVIDSGSRDKTALLAQESGFEVLRIEPSTFNHGGTRQLGADKLADCGIIIYLTQDAILASPDSLALIAGCFEDPSVAVAYGRQLPHEGATPVESHARLFSYGQQTVKKDRSVIASMGAKAFFCSNSFAAYRRSILMALGGFHENLILGEDMEFAARAIQAGYANAYCAEATVYHSHDYTLKQTLSRYFDLGVFDVQNSWMREAFGSQTGEGLKFVKSELRYLMRRAPLQIPLAMCLTAAKLTGYRLGRIERLLSLPLKRKLSMFPNYFKQLPS